MPRVLTLTILALGLAGSTSILAQQPLRTPTSVGTNTARTPAPPPREAPRLLPGTRSESSLSTIQGNALDASDKTLSNNLVRLRDARYGRIVDQTMTDKTGLFSFHSVDPGSYIVELLAPDQSVLAASQILNVNAGEAALAIVKVPFHIPPFAGVLGHSAPSALLVTTTAAASGVLATEVAGAQESPRR